MKREVSFRQALATHQLPGESRGGDDVIANAMMIGWVGGYPDHTVSLHAHAPLTTTKQ